MEPIAEGSMELVKSPGALHMNLRSRTGTLLSMAVRTMASLKTAKAAAIAWELRWSSKLPPYIVQTMVGMPRPRHRCKAR